MKTLKKPIGLFIGCLAAIAILFFLTEDMSRPDASEYPRTVSTAIIQDHSTSLGQALAPEIKIYPGMSGFRFLATGTDSLKFRLALVQAAEKTLDLQYYTIHDDTSANLLLEAMLRAAGRGVRIRFLIDNTSMKDVGESLSVLDGNKNIEIRVFNPLVTRNQGIFSRVIGIFSDLSKVTKRMHNKVLISDNQMAILGGRNLGDEYFDAHADVNFKDSDILAAGPITARISRNFDKYWNSDDAFPITALRRPETDADAMEKIKAGMKKHWDKELETEEGRKMLESKLSQRLKDADVRLVWARAELAADEPSKIDRSAENAVSKPMERMESLLEDANKEFIAVSPYFVPQDEGVAWLAGLVKRGFTVKVLTNSLASTDVVAAHTGYKRYRKQLAESGVELYELKPIAGKRPPQRLAGTTAPAHASLHAKVYIIDRRKVVIGSFNFDPRSISLNTEIALVIHSAEIAGQILKMFEEAVSPKSSYRITARKVGERTELVWEAEEKGRTVRFNNDPRPGFWRSIQAEFMALLPVEDQL